MPKSTAEKVSIPKLSSNWIDFTVEEEIKMKKWRSSSQIYQISSIFSPLAGFLLLVYLVTPRIFVLTFPRIIITAAKAVTVTRCTRSQENIQCKVGVSTQCN